MEAYQLNIRNCSGTDSEKQVGTGTILGICKKGYNPTIQLKKIISYN